MGQLPDGKRTKPTLVWNFSAAIIQQKWSYGLVTFDHFVGEQPLIV